MATPAHACSGAQKRAEVLRNPCILGDPQRQARGQNQKWLSPLHSLEPQKGRNCYATPAFSGIPNAKLGDKIKSGYLTPAFSQAQRRAELLRNPAFSGIPNAKRGNIIRSGYLSPAFSEAQKRAELLRNPCILGDPQCQARGQKSEVASSPLHSWGPKRGRNCYVAPAFTEIPNAKRREKFGSG